jgi:hypothetical protein
MMTETDPPATTETVAGQPSWRVASDCVDACLTQTGGHLGPVTFDLAGQRVQPFSIAPWAEQTIDQGLPPLIHALRGDFFCLPFGGNDTPYDGEQHPPHGQTANGQWQARSLDHANGWHTLHLAMDTTIRPGHVDKQIALRDGHTAVYCRDTITGMTGAMPLGHHAMLKFPDQPASGRISTSGFIHGQVYHQPFEDPASGGQSCLQPAATFDRLDRVPTTTGELTDVSRYPARPGYDDMVQLYNDPSDDWAWTAVTFPEHGYVWIALKDPSLLRSTVIWLSNGGRPYAPWNSRHVAVAGLEEVTGFFHEGLAASAAPNAHAEQGLQTTVALDPDRPTHVNCIMAMAAIPAGFDRVHRIHATEAGLRLEADSDQTADLPLDLDWLHGPA